MREGVLSMHRYCFSLEGSASLPAWSRARVTSLTCEPCPPRRRPLWRAGTAPGPWPWRCHLCSTMFLQERGWQGESNPQGLGRMPTYSFCGPTADLHHDPAVTSYPFLLQARNYSDFSLGIFSNRLVHNGQGTLLVSEGKPSATFFLHY